MIQAADRAAQTQRDQPLARPALPSTNTVYEL
jgi:hypothetical protein